MAWLFSGWYWQAKMFSFLQRRGEPPAVIGKRGGDRLLRRRIVGVDEIEVGAVGDAVEHGRRLCDLHVVPAHVGYLHVALETDHPAPDHGHAFDPRRLFG